MEEQEQNPDTQPTPDDPESGAQARADFMSTATREQQNAWLDDVGKFGRVLNGHLADSGITDDVSIDYVKRLFTAAATEKKASNSAEWTAVFMNDVMPRVQEWRSKSERRAILDSSDEDFAKYDEQRTKARHQQQRDQLRDKAIAIQDRAASQHSAVKEGKDIASMTDDEFRAFDAKRTAIRHATLINREALAADEWRTRAAEDRARRAK